MEVNDFLDMRAKDLICKMEVEFDSHTFITRLLQDYEKDYVELLNSHIESSGIFRALHARIGKYLSDNEVQLSITKIKKVKSDNIKDYESKNQKWRKTL